MPDGPDTRIRSLLRRRDFALLTAAGAISMVGDGAYFVGIAWQVAALHGSPGSLALVGIAWSIGLLLALPAGGALADRRSRRAILVAADTVRFGVLGAAGVLSLTGDLRIWEAVALSVVHGAAEGCFTPALTGFVPHVVEQAQLPAANAVEGITRPLAYRLAGPALGGLLIATVGAGGALVADGVSFGLSALLIARIVTSRRAPATGGPSSFGDQVRAGWAFVARTGWLWRNLLAVSIGLLCFWGPTEVALPFLIRNHLHSPASVYGLVLTANGAGALIGAWAIRRAADTPRAPWLMCALPVFSLLAVSGYGISDTAAEILVFAAIFGGGLAAAQVLWVSLLQQRVPDGLLGRVASLDQASSLALTPVSFAIAGPLATHFGAPSTLVAGGLLGAVALLGALVTVPPLIAASAA